MDISGIFNARRKKLTAYFHPSFSMKSRIGRAQNPETNITVSLYSNECGIALITVTHTKLASRKLIIIFPILKASPL